MNRLCHLAALPLLALAACVPGPGTAPAPTPAPAPAPAPRPTPAPAPPAPPPFAGTWHDAPLTPGDWTYAGGVARFGLVGYAPALTLRCDRAAGSIDLFLPGSTAAQVIVRSEFGDRALAAQPSGNPPQLVARIAARDALLDSMAFSKGRFALEIPGQQTLYIPSFPEVTRVVEDCR